MLTFLAPAAPAADPHERVQERVTLVPGLHRDTDTVLVSVGVDRVGRSLIVDLVQHVLGPRQPSLGLRDDERGRVVSGLE